MGIYCQDLQITVIFLLSARARDLEAIVDVPLAATSGRTCFDLHCAGSTFA